MEAVKLKKGDIVVTRAVAGSHLSRLWTVQDVDGEGVRLTNDTHVRVDHPNNLIGLANESDFESEEQLTIYKKVMDRIYPPDEYDASSEDLWVYVEGRWRSLTEVFEMNYPASGPETYDL